MKYAQGKSFTVPASAGKLETCVRDGHAWADRKGKCVRCGNKIRASGFGAPEPIHPEAKRRPKENSHPSSSG